MLNQFICVGRLVTTSKIKETEDGQQVCNITIAVPRSYKNENGQYDTDFIDVVLSNNIAKNTAEYFCKGDIIGVKGRIETREINIKDSEYKQKITKIIAEKISFLSRKKESED